MATTTQRISLTGPIVKALEPPATGRLFVYDAKTPGLVLAVTSTGKKTFKLYRRVNGVPKRILLGRWPRSPWSKRETGRRARRLKSSTASTRTK